MPERPEAAPHLDSAEGADRTRRTFMKYSLGGWAALLAAGVQASAGVEVPGAQTGARESRLIRNDEDVDRLLPELSNWGRWGKEDQLGTLNYIDGGRRRRAAALVKTGRTVSLAREISLTRTEGVRRGTYEMMRSDEGSRDFVGMIPHGFALTHLDALCHAFASKEKMYNGFPTDAVTAQGATKLGAEVMGAQGVCGRGVLLDVAAVKGRPLEPGTAIYPEDLEEAEKAHRVTVGEGDVLFVRNGAGARNTRERRSGLHPQCLPWVHARKIALLGSDGDNDVHPAAGFERWASAMHGVGIPYLGLPLIDNAELDTLSRVCREERRWAFLLTVAPWRLQGTTSSPVNPLALF